MSEDEIPSDHQRAALGSDYAEDRRDYLRQALTSRCRYSARKGWRVSGYVSMRDVEPDRQDDLVSASNFPLHKTIQLILRPVLSKERLAKDYNSEAGITKSTIYGLT